MTLALRKASTSFRSGDPMRLFLRLLAITAVFFFTCLAWLGLGGMMEARSSAQRSALSGQVADLWGTPLRQRAPQLTFRWETRETHTDWVTDSRTGKKRERTRELVHQHERPVHLSQSRIKAAVELDQRRKGLLWFPLYNIDFDAVYGYTHDTAESGRIEIQFPFPSQAGFFDDFRFEVEGALDPNTQPSQGVVTRVIEVEPGQEITAQLGYRSRAMSNWVYLPADRVTELRDFQLALTTDFADIDYPSFTLSPTSRSRAGEGWNLSWDFNSVVTGHGMGMVMPQRIQPGELAAELAYTAPISLLFFFAIIFVLSVLKGLDIHPLNYALLAGAFFSFHLLFGYLADHLAIELGSWLKMSFVCACLNSISIIWTIAPP